ncbi:uncharacterized protein FYW47_005748 [Aplochiton taeniatus]
MTATSDPSSTLMTDLTTETLIRTTKNITNTSHSIPPSSDKQPIPSSSGPECLFVRKHGTSLLIVTACLIVVCTILLVISVALASQVCHLRGRLHRSTSISSRPTRSNADLISNSGYWAGTNTRTRGLSETEANEVSILMRQVSQAQQGERASVTEVDGGNPEKNGLMKQDKAKTNSEDVSAEGKESGGDNKERMDDVPTDATGKIYLQQSSRQQHQWKDKGREEKERNDRDKRRESDWNDKMKGRLVLPMAPGGALMLSLLLTVLLLGLHSLAMCPSACSCSDNHRHVDCSGRGLGQLPHRLQHNLHSLNLSHNRLTGGLDGQLTAYNHLRVLDLSHNHLAHLPVALPRALWELHVANNHVRLLEKNDTAYQWNLQLLDMSHNRLERAVFINNTLVSLRLLNFSHNHFWTVPTNMPAGLQTVDLSHNSLVQVLPGSLDRLAQLAHFYLHTNRFVALPRGALGRLTGLRLITLGDNPWGCNHHADMAPLLSWLQLTQARVLGCPCHSQPVCGEARPTRTGGWHFASYTLPPLAAGRTVAFTQRVDTFTQQESVTSLKLHPATDPSSLTDSPAANDNSHGIPNRVLIPHSPYVTWDRLFTTEHISTTEMTLATHRSLTTVPSTITKKTTTLRTRSVRRPNQAHPSGVRNRGENPKGWPSHPLTLWPLTVTLIIAH